ncbi:LysR family transcriptional regulator [Paenirhodobacter enshiensis]|uniref:LysR family transcriptional regulator n=1 Tax=Paenirhodobacter enshiensis TaxID=1105367 RepID=UPI0035B1F3CE
MNLELRHLRAIRAIHETGGLARAADILHVTQSALSHQMKGLEEQAQVELFVRRAKPLRLSVAGMKLLRLAERVLPEIAAAEAEFDALREGRAGRLHLAIECHACYDWLFPVLEKFRRKWPEVDIDIRAGLAFNALPALARQDVDLVISSDPVEIEGITFNPLFDYSPTFIAATSSPLADRPYVVAEDFLDQTLITYPIDRARSDVFSMLLTPAHVEPRVHRQVELTAVILMLVAAGRGVSVLPDWVLREVKYQPDYVTRPVTAQGLRKSMYAATRSEDVTEPFMACFLDLARSEPRKLQQA